MRVSIGDVRLFVEVVGAKLEHGLDGPRERPTLVALHGGPGYDHTLTRRLKEALAFAVSVTTRSSFGTAFHLGEMRRLGVTERGVIEVLGVTQILAWGAIFYPPVLTLPLIAADRGWSITFVMGGFSLALLVAGLVSPLIGHHHALVFGVLMVAAILMQPRGLIGIYDRYSPGPKPH